MSEEITKAVHGSLSLDGVNDHEEQKENHLSISASLSSNQSYEKNQAAVTEGEVLSPVKTNDDRALRLLREAHASGGHVEITPEQNKKLLRKIDFYVLPLICAVYFLQYLDKVAISYGSVTGLKTATHLEGNDFQWVASMFFFGQLAFQFPTIRLIQMFPLAKYVSFWVISWGMILACLAACKSYAGLLVCRFFLGVSEAAVMPAWVLFTSQWYKKSEQAFRVGIWYSMSGAAQMFGGYVAYGIAAHVGQDPNASLEGWQIIFVLLGCLTIFIGFIFLFLLPDSPDKARFLTQEEKLMHIERIRENEQGIGSNTFKVDQFKEALIDYKTWLYAFWILAANITNSTATSFGNLLITGMGYSNLESLYLVTPLGAVEIVVLVGITYIGMKTNQRIFWCLVAHIPCITGAVMMAASTNKVAALIGYYLTGSLPIGYTVILGLTATNIAGSTKKVTCTCLTAAAYTVGNIISPQTFQTKDYPRYLPGKISVCVLYFVCAIDFVIIRQLAIRDNKRRAEKKKQLGANYVVEENHEFKDLTDWQNLELKYAI